jgi:peptidoglycan/xylan/chitin deacetylase (PgdA/CDA1 family)
MTDLALSLMAPKEQRLQDAGARAMHILARFAPFRRHTMALDRPMVSFTFDDVPVSACTRGADALEAAGGRGTYYVATGLMGIQTAHWTLAGPDEIRDLARRGHDIGLHTHDHRPVSALSARDFSEDLAQNRKILREIVPDLVDESFAFPYGINDVRRKFQASRQVRSCRTIRPGVNHGILDLDGVLSVELTDRMIDIEEVQNYLDEAVARCGWVVFFTHDVADRPSPWGTSPALFEAAIQAAKTRDMAIVSVAQALDHVGAPRLSKNKAK